MVKKSIKEFSKYGKYAKIVEEMIENDNIKYVKPFYEFLSNKMSVKYVDNFWKALSELKKKNKGIIATRIEIVNQDHLENECACNQEYKICDNNDGDKFSSHAVSLFKDNKKIYMFDPNGVFIKSEHMWLYKSKDNKRLLDSNDFMKETKLILPEHKGVQAYCKILKVNQEFIDNAGYCMFYNFIGIAYIIKQIENNYNDNIVELIKSVSDLESKNRKKLYNIFPKDKDIGKISLKIIENVFK